MFAKTFGCCRKIYNLMLSDKIESYKVTGKFPTVTPAKYKKDYPYLKEVDEAKLDKDSLGQRLVYGDRHIICENDAFVLRKNETKEELERIPIDQNEDGIDTVDRILLLKSFVAQLTAVKQE